MSTLTHSMFSVTVFKKQNEHSRSAQLGASARVEQDPIPSCVIPKQVGLCFNLALFPYMRPEANTNTGIFWVIVRKGEFKTSLSLTGYNISDSRQTSLTPVPLPLFLFL